MKLTHPTRKYTKNFQTLTYQRVLIGTPGALKHSFTQKSYALPRSSLHFYCRFTDRLPKHAATPVLRQAVYDNHRARSASEENSFDRRRHRILNANECTCALYRRYRLDRKSPAERCQIQRNFLSLAIIADK